MNPILDKNQNRIKVEILGRDGNAFAILGATTKAMQRAGVSKEIRDEFLAEATSGDYDNLLSTVMQYFDVE
jgi:hypothetical protein